jgi:hypothetical protein
MSSLYVRTEIETYIGTALPTESLVDLTADFEVLDKMLFREGITGNDPWLGIQYVGSDEIPVAVASTNNTGKYRETGAIYIHVVEKTRVNVHTAILTRAELVRDAFRGRNVNGVRIESVSPPNFGTGATLNFEGGYTSASVILVYEYDLNL